MSGDCSTSVGISSQGNRGNSRDRHARGLLVADCVKKSFLGDERNFLGPLMRFARGDVRDHIVSHKIATDLRIGAKERCGVETAKNRLSRDF